MSTPSSVIWSWAAAVEVPYQPAELGQLGGHLGGLGGGEGGLLLHLDALLSQGIQKDTAAAS